MKFLSTMINVSLHFRKVALPCAASMPWTAWPRTSIVKSELSLTQQNDKASPPELLARLIQDLQAASMNNMNLDMVDSSSRTSKDMRDSDNNRHATRRPSQRSKVAGKRLNFGPHSGKYDHKLNKTEVTSVKLVLFKWEKLFDILT